MTKREKNRIERERLDNMLKNPILQKVIGGLVEMDEDNMPKTIEEAITPIIQEQLNKAQMMGIKAGWITLLRQVYRDLEGCVTLDEFKAKLKEHEIEVGGEVNESGEDASAVDVEEVSGEAESQS